MKSYLKVPPSQAPNPEIREATLRRQRLEQLAFDLIAALASLRPSWCVEGVPRAAVETLIANWDSIEITKDDLAALRDWPGLPLTLPGLLTDLDQHVEDAWDDCLEIG